jgi:hypothetical protein
MMRVDWQAPVSLHIHPDVTDPAAGQLRRSSDGAVQLLIGSDVVAYVWVQDAVGPVHATVGQAVNGVTSVELEHSTIAELPAAADDDTVVSSGGIVASSGALQPSLTRVDNDVDDTIIGQPAVEPLGGVDVAAAADDPDADADTVIGSGRRRPEQATRAPEPAAVSILPPPLPSIPGVPASAHVNAGVPPTGGRRTRIEPDASELAHALNAVVFPDGRSIVLYRPVYVGRSPRSPRITSGLVPELVAVPSPRREVSATHIEIQQEGRAVVVRDLGSTNGTRLSAPGAPPSVLSPGASRVVAAGTRLDLGDDVVLEIVARPGARPGGEA